MKTKSYVSFLALTAFLAMHVFAEDPDVAYEAELHGIFLNFHNQPTSSDQWSAVVGNRQTEVFEIRNGDTLWDISQTLFADGNFWPKIWSLNPAISNPHLISPGMVVQFALGDSANPPAFTITEKSAVESQAPLSMTASNDSMTSQVVKPDGTVEVIEMPNPSRTYEPVLNDLPPSLPSWQLATPNKYDASGIEFVRRPISVLKNKRTLENYVTEVAPEPLGKVAETEAGSTVAGQFQYIYIALSPGSGKPGDTLLAISNRGKLKRLNREVETRGGLLIEIQGEVQLVEQVQGKDDDYDWYRALVTQSINPVEVGSSIVPGRLNSFEVNGLGPRSQVVTQVIGGNHDNKGFLFGTGATVFLNRGSNDGANVGDVLPIRKNLKARFESSKLQEVSNPIAILQIAYVEPEFSTAIILNSWEEVRPGDITGEGKIFINSLSDNGDSDNLKDAEVDVFADELTIEDQEDAPIAKPLDEASKPADTNELGEELSWDQTDESLELDNSNFDDAEFEESDLDGSEQSNEFED